MLNDLAFDVGYSVIQPDGGYWCCWQSAFVSADLFDNCSPLDDWAEDVVSWFSLGDGVKLAPIFLHDERDGDSVGGAEG